MKKAAKQLNLSRFEPVTAAATSKIQELIRVGAKLIAVERGFVRLRRMDSVATVDGCGRVTWEAAPRGR